MWPVATILDCTYKKIYYPRKFYFIVLFQADFDDYMVCKELFIGYLGEIVKY